MNNPIQKPMVLFPNCRKTFKFLRFDIIFFCGYKFYKNKSFAKTNLYLHRSLTLFCMEYLMGVKILHSQHEFWWQQHFLERSPNNLGDPDFWKYVVTSKWKTVETSLIPHWKAGRVYLVLIICLNGGLHV